MFKQVAYERLRATLVIDPMALDKELVEFPGLMVEAAEIAGDAIQRKDRAEQDYKVAVAIAAAELRETEGPNGKPLSETAIASQAPLAAKPQEALAYLNDARGDAAYWNALVSAMMTKQMAIKRLVDLFLAGYFTSASAVRDARADIADERRARTRVKLATPAAARDD